MLVNSSNVDSKMYKSEPAQAESKPPTCFGSCFEFICKGCENLTDPYIYSNEHFKVPPWQPIEQVTSVHPASEPERKQFSWRLIEQQEKMSELKEVFVQQYNVLIKQLAEQQVQLAEQKAKLSLTLAAIAEQKAALTTTKKVQLALTVTDESQMHEMRVKSEEQNNVLTKQLAEQQMQLANQKKQLVESAQELINLKKRLLSALDEPSPCQQGTPKKNGCHIQRIRAVCAEHVDPSASFDSSVLKPLDEPHPADDPPVPPEVPHFRMHSKQSTFLDDGEMETPSISTDDENTMLAPPTPPSNPPAPPGQQGESTPKKFRAEKLDASTCDSSPSLSPKDDTPEKAKQKKDGSKEFVNAFEDLSTPVNTSVNACQEFLEDESDSAKSIARILMGPYGL